MTIRICSATEEDEAAIMKLWRDCGLVVGSSDPVRDFRAVRGGPSSDILAAFGPDGLLIGSIAVGYDSNRGWLHYVSVDPTRRGAGVGRDLVRAAEQWLAARDVMDVHLTVRSANAAVVRFYEHIGYGAVPSILMEKALRRPE
ncbi:MAG: GNAT family N-acetyltransferase [Rhizomicrobium sp.]